VQTALDAETAARKARLLYEKLAEPFVGREEEAKVLVLAVLTGEHALLVGEPGTAKSALARRLAGLLDARFFKYLLTKYTEPGELLGPLDIRALREGEYRRITKGKLPEAEIAFLDEIFNANSAVLNSLLSIMQERVVYDGYTEIRTNVWSIIAASNTVPEEAELQALYDRFLFRHRVEPLPPDYWGPLLEAAWNIERSSYVPSEPLLSIAEIKEIYNYIMNNIDPFPIRDKLIKLFMILEDKGFHLTDRRKGKTLKAIAAHALLEGRTVVTEQDLFVLKYVVPKDPEDFVQINSILLEELKTRERIIRELKTIETNLENISNEINRIASFDPKLIEYYRVLKATKAKVQNLAKDLEDEELVNLASRIVETVDELITIVMEKLNV